MARGSENISRGLMELLEEVIDSLERLRDDDLIVGVISHVPALADRIRSGQWKFGRHAGRSTILHAS